MFTTDFQAMRYITDNRIYTKMQVKKVSPLKLHN